MIDNLNHQESTAEQCGDGNTLLATNSQRTPLANILGMTLPDVGEETIDISRQFRAMLATSRMQKDYEMAENLVQMIEKNKEYENYNAMSIIAILNQCELFEFRNGFKKNFSYEEDKREIELRNKVKTLFRNNQNFLNNILVETIFKKDYQTLLANFIIKTENLDVIKEGIDFIKEIFGEKSLEGDLRYMIEKNFMKSSIEYYDNKISGILTDQILDYYDDHQVPLEMDIDPRYTFPNEISSFTERYLSDPRFVFENLNKTARNQIRKYHMIQKQLSDILNILMKQTEKSDYALKEIFLDEDNRNKSESVFELILQSENLSEDDLKQRILSGLKSIVNGEESDDDSDHN